MWRSATSILSNVHVYLAFQRMFGADRLRYHCIDLLAPKPGERLLDVGCGPAYYVDRLPDVEYYGFDTDPGYIAYARSRFGDRATFRCEVFGEDHAADLAPVDGVLLMGLLHHLSDAQSAELLDLLRNVLAPGGRVVTVDTCFDESQTRFRRFVAESDRGEHVRYGREFDALAEPYFGEVRGEFVTELCRVPSTHYVMRLSSPRRAAG